MKKRKKATDERKKSVGRGKERKNESKEKIAV